MKMVSWNCSGLRSLCAIRALLRLTRKEKPLLVFLMETSKVTWDGKNKKGGMVLILDLFSLVKEMVEKERGVLHSFGMIILISLSCAIHWTAFVGRWRILRVISFGTLLGFMGSQLKKTKRKTWDLIKDLVSYRGWKVAMLWGFEWYFGRKGKTRGKHQQWWIVALLTKDFLVILLLGQMGIVREITYNVDLEELWRLWFSLANSPKSKLLTFGCFGSNHSALRVELEILSQVGERKKKVHVFHFEKCLADDNRCEDFVQSTWLHTRGNCIRELASLHSLDDDFKEYRTSEVRKELLKKRVYLVWLKWGPYTIQAVGKKACKSFESWRGYLVSKKPGFLS